MILSHEVVANMEYMDCCEGCEVFVEKIVRVRDCKPIMVNDEGLCHYKFLREVDNRLMLFLVEDFRIIDALVWNGSLTQESLNKFNLLSSILAPLFDMDLSDCNEDT